MSGKVAVTKDGLAINHNPSWFLKNAEFPPTGSSFSYLINGQRAFSHLYNELVNAEKTIDIAIWGFQPSMFFLRDQKAECIGDLLIKKAKQGVKVRVLVWAMLGNVQTISEANMGNTAQAYKKRVGKGVTQEQLDYDRLWYYAVGYDKYNAYPYGGTPIILENILKKHPHIREFKNSPYRKNLSFKVRRVEFKINSYLDNLSFITKAILFSTTTHHQKTVLIDYETPKKARGYILEHNMLDNYWDNDAHSTAKIEPNKGKNTSTPLQDISSFVRGPILHDINYNFCQSWDKETNEGLLGKRKNVDRRQYLVDHPIAIQALRTYTDPKREEIKDIYLQNIKKTTSYIYTENQYFRWPPLVEAFKKHWVNMKAADRKEPIYWFAVTNSSDAGIGPGIINSHRMFEALGRRDVMPVVAISRSQVLRKELYLAQYDTIKKLREGPQNNGGNEGIKKLTKKLDDIAENFYKDLKKDLSKAIGIKIHICVLNSMYSKGKDWSEKNWQEVYIHSKVTMINDTFLTMGSANINSRSMQGDTEMNLALEDSQTVKKMRQELWALNTRSAPANPAAMHLNTVAKAVFKEWQTLIDGNAENKKQGKKPLQPLSEFLRLSPDVSNSD